MGFSSQPDAIHDDATILLDRAGNHPAQPLAELDRVVFAPKGVTQAGDDVGVLKLALLRWNRAPYGQWSNTVDY